MRRPKHSQQAVHPHRRQLVSAGRTGVREPSTKASGPAGISRSVAYYWITLPTIGRFAITLGLAATFAAPFDRSRRNARRCLRGGPVILLRFKCKIFDEDSDRPNRDTELT
jgi:hypothetical protein